MMMTISLVSLILVISAIGGILLFASREGGMEGEGDPGGNFEGPDDIPIGNNDTMVDEDPYDDVPVNDPVPDDKDDNTNNEDNKTDPADDNSTSPDPDDNSTEPPKDDNITEPEDNKTDPTDDNSTSPDPDDNSTEPPKDDNTTMPDDNTTNGSDGPFLYTGKIEIEGIGTFTFEPWKIRTTRPYVFANGHFSLFDILVYLNHTGMIDLRYHFEDPLDTFVIDSIDNRTDWWYWAYYSGGWQESNAWRMDLYPYKDNTTTMVYQEDSWMMGRIHDSFRSQVERRTRNGGKVIIPSVRIRAPSGNLEFKDVEVTAHNLRNDSFKQGVITAIDVILSLGDQGKLTYDLKWYETIGYADPVKNYWVEGINEDHAYGTCGFVYEAGEENMGGHNHIHIPSDQRVLTSPEYELWFWICL